MAAIKIILAGVGATSRVVGVGANSSLSSLKREIFRTFSDIPRLATAKNLLMQVKDEEWGEFVDMNSDDTIPDRAELLLMWYLRYATKKCI